MSPRAVVGLSLVLGLVLQGALDQASAQGIRVNGPLLREPGLAGEDVAGFALAEGGATAVFLADPEEDQRFEIFAVPADGGSPWRRLSPDGSSCLAPLSTGAGRVAFLCALSSSGPF